MTSRMLELRGITRVFGTSTATQALRGVDLDVDDGEFVALTGPSGGGKSTTLNIIGLLDTASGGEYRVRGRDVSTLTGAERARMRSDWFGFIFQGFHLLDRRPVLDSVELGLVYRGVGRSERRRRAGVALERVGLGNRAHSLAGSLSGGERQRVAIARALTTGAPVLIADEPTGNLDSANARQVVDALTEVHSAGTTVILVTHDADVAAVADRRVHLRDGRVEDGADGTPTSSASATAAIGCPPGRPSKVKLRDLLRDAGASISSRVGRTSGLAAAVAVAVALAVATGGISLSARAQVADTFDAHTSRDVTATWSADDESALTAQQRNPTAIATKLGEMNGVEAVGIVGSYGQATISPSPVAPDFNTNAYTMTEGAQVAGRQRITWMPRHDHTLADHDAVIGRGLAAQLELGPLAGGPQVRVDGTQVRVVGILEESPRMPELLSAVLLAPAASRWLGYRGMDTAWLLTHVGAAQVVSHQVAKSINPYQPETVAVQAPVDPSTVRAEVEGEVQATLLILTAVALLAAIVGLANAMLLSVMERRYEFGLRSALGARPAHIAGLVLVESGAVGFLGGLAGLALGLAATLAVTIARHWSPVFDLRLAPLAVVGGIMVGALGGLIAAFRAARIEPSDALRQ
ncbi:ABC transporter ATP-binding protein/permease [Microbacterium protaetiae]|uniref:ABC transporter ATP-binding protein/permease n=1 Tax=Microbacterium protaetiae TaxID=2509458 RepID=A0A4P6ERB3_9MICO|nr:ABC transporter ATP-binding protein/permease [Microbacterium protaetiae]QAY60438.1 ABC transporter ATP-binding protein/permease [Microbacterium protaetiae]